MILVIPPILRTGPDEFRNSVRLLRNAFTDLHFEEKEIITTDDKVVARSIVAK